ncbi:hypothetical protein [Actinomycetospora sp. CA-053990]|uniref:hypothetical protein n=1 Tax=Actinomycetospora sp. CA-053990 TaxID=3239891 RepID=UPI003D9172F0
MSDRTDQEAQRPSENAAQEVDDQLDDLAPEFADLHEEEQESARRLRDPDESRDVWKDLCAVDFEGPRWIALAKRLTSYALTVLGAWTAGGVIVEQCCRVLDRPLEPTPADWSARERDAMVDNTIIRALRLFEEKGRRRDEWSEDGEISLASYFIATCLIVYLDEIYADWRASRTSAPGNDAEMELGSATGGEEDEGLDADSSLPTTAGGSGLPISPGMDDRQALFLYGKGYTSEEVREIMAIEMLRRKLEGGSS